MLESFDLGQVAQQLAVASASHTAQEIYTRVRAHTSGKPTQEAINQLQEIIDQLIQERNDLLLLARGLHDEIESRTLDESSFEYIVGQLIPKLELMLQESSSEAGAGAAQQALELIKGLLTPDLLNVIQVLGFDYKEAIGKPLTHVVQSHILKLRAATDSRTAASLQTLALHTELARVSQDREAAARLEELMHR